MFFVYLSKYVLYRKNIRQLLSLWHETKRNELPLQKFRATQFSPLQRQPQLARFNTVDPKSEKYFEWSPYNYVGGNPIIRIDRNGEDWEPTINHEDRTITIKANFITNISGSSVQDAADNWNAQSGKFSYVVGKGDEAISYSINFEVSVNDNTATEAINSVIEVLDSHPMFAERVVENADGSKTIIKPQGGSNGVSIGIKQSQSGDDNIISHEMGHNFGMTHKKGINIGLMRKTAGGKNLSKKHVKQTVNSSISGVNNKNKAKIVNPTIIGKPPTNFNNGKIKKNKEWEKTKF